MEFDGPKHESMDTETEDTKVNTTGKTTLQQLGVSPSPHPRVSSIKSVASLDFHEVAAPEYESQAPLDPPPPAYEPPMENQVITPVHATVLSNQESAPVRLVPPAVSGPVRLPPRVMWMTPEILPDGCKRYSHRPSCLFIVLMMPVPFWCMGCCLSVSTDVIFDEQHRRISYQSWPGYYCCCKRPVQSFDYDQVAHIVALRDFENASSIYRPKYSVHMVLHSGVRMRLSDYEPFEEMSPLLLAWHRLVFAQPHPPYQPPEADTLKVES